MLHAFALAFRQLKDPALLAILARSLALTLTLFLLAGIGLFLLLDTLMTRVARTSDGGALAAMLALAAGAALFWLTFRGVAIAIAGLFGDEVVHEVERRHYPAALSSARPVPSRRALATGLRSLARLVGYNLLAVPLYLVAAVTGIGLPLAFFALNGWLLGRDLGDMVAVRHIDPSQLQDWRARTRWTRLGAGLAASGLFVIPVVNFVAPVVGAAAMTHLFHRARRRESGAR